MSDHSSLGILVKLLFAVIGLMYAGFLLLYSDAQYLFHFFFSLVLLNFLIAQLTRKFFNRRFWWTGFCLIYAGLTLYHFQFSKDPTLIFEAIYIVLKKYLLLVF